MGDPTLEEEGGAPCPSCGTNVPCIVQDKGEKIELPCRNCNPDEFTKAFRKEFNKIVDNT